MNESVVHLSGSLVGPADASVSCFDRGFLYGDGVYEGLRTLDGRIVGERAHVERLRAGLAEARISGFEPESLVHQTHELLAANGIEGEAFVYWQVTRGTPLPLMGARRRVPDPSVPPTVFGYAERVRSVAPDDPIPTRAAIVVDDKRWTRGHLKATSLLGGVISAIEAHEQEADEAIFVRDGVVTEATATNIFVRTGDRIVTPPLGDGFLLGGVTRMLLLRAAPEIEERPVSLDELLGADEVILVGTRTMLARVETIAGRSVGTGPGRARELRSRLIDEIARDVERSTPPTNSKGAPAHV
ncbi:MAG: aminotransferase class IV [Planctomycetota bacterium]